ncbi:hypothetical protein C8F01DRAFT_1084918 [Mycena amicta]|nr:hypothetical protein C8F01DRAFT_1084918 [Mycena amicta]
MYDPDPRRVSVGGLGQNGTPAYNTAGAVGYTPSHGLSASFTLAQKLDVNYPSRTYSTGFRSVSRAGSSRSQPPILPGPEYQYWNFPAAVFALMRSFSGPEAPAGNPYYYDPRTNYPRQRPMTMQPPVEEAAYGANDYLPRNRPSQSNSVQNMGVVNARISRPTTPPHFEQTVDPRMLFRGSAGPTGSFPDSGVGQHSVQISSAVGGHRSRSKKDIGTAPQHPYGRLQDVAPPLPVRQSQQRRVLNVAPIATVPEVLLSVVIHELKHGVHRPLKTAERQQKRILGGGKR